MTTEWTAARLDALPDCTVIEVWREDWQCWVRFVWDGDVWQSPGEYDSYQSARLAGLRIRVVSVSVDALLSFPAFTADVLSASTDQVMRKMIPLVTAFVLNGVIAHVTGESTEDYSEAVRPAIERWSGKSS